METQTFESYIKQVREITSQQSEQGHIKNADIIRLIEDHLAIASESSSDEAFFQGELKFYSEEYEQALKYYLDAKEIPCFQFYCYRASSLIARDRNQLDKALSYAQKALKLDFEDILMRQVITSLEGDQSLINEKSSSYEGPVDEEGYPLHAQEMSDAIQHCMQGRQQRGSSSFGHTFQQEAHQTELFEEELSNVSPLERRIRSFQRLQIENMQSYIQATESHMSTMENTLYILNGWNFHPVSKPLMFTEESRKSTGGHYLRWHGKGIAINPGPGFLENFHSQGLCIRDIDYVIVTRNNRDAYGDVKVIAELNQQLNKTAPERQLIHYFLHHRVCLELARFLKPSFKQARNTIHKLEMFLDSPDVEKIDLNDEITLYYFLTAMPSSAEGYREIEEHAFSQSNLGIRLEMTKDNNRKLKVGYLSGMGWTPLLANHLGQCDLLLAAFGNTNPTDYAKLGYNEDCLGYYGSKTLLEELSPRIMMLTEFGGREGDIRIEAMKQMRADYKKTSPHSHSSVIAADIGLVINLNTLNVKCSISEASVSSDEVSVVASSDSFGRLRYLSSNYFS